MEAKRMIDSFKTLGEHLRDFGRGSASPAAGRLTEAAEKASASNPWFTPAMIRNALTNLGEALECRAVDEWLAPYCDKLAEARQPQRIGLVMAGNIPAAGFHDFLCVLVAGHRLTGRLSSSDAFLLPAMAGLLEDIDPAWSGHIILNGEKLSAFDAVIATGSDNTSRYFDYYFGRYPHIIRKNRNGVAILDGHESPADLDGVADDIMLYFGLGCRNISKIFLPPGYHFEGLAGALSRYQDLLNHNKYRNNFDYQRSVLMVNGISFLEPGPVIFRREESIASPVAVVHYDYYSRPEDLGPEITRHSDNIQCVVSACPLPFPSVMPGTSQKPALGDYADGVDTLEFLLSLKG